METDHNGARMETLTMETDNGANQKRVLTYPGGVGKKKGKRGVEGGKKCVEKGKERY